MTDRTIYEMRDKLAATLAEGLDDERLEAFRKKLDGVVEDVFENLTWWIKDEFSLNLAGEVYTWFERAFEAMLAGNEELFRRYLYAEGSGWTGRNGRHSVIHGKLHEAKCIELRRKLCDAYPDLLKNERILDLEDQVAALVKTVNDLEARNSNLVARLNEALA